MVRGCPDTLAERRDRALLLLGIAGTLAGDVEHLTESTEGLRILIAGSQDRPGAKAPLS